MQLSLVIHVIASYLAFLTLYSLYNNWLIRSHVHKHTIIMMLIIMVTYQAYLFVFHKTAWSILFDLGGFCRAKNHHDIIDM